MMYCSHYSPYCSVSFPGLRVLLELCPTLNGLVILHTSAVIHHTLHKDSLACTLKLSESPVLLLAGYVYTNAIKEHNWFKHITISPFV